MPAVPRVYSQPGAEVVDQAAIDANNRERRKQATRYGRQSTILAGNSAGSPPTAGAKTLLGS